MSLTNKIVEIFDLLKKEGILFCLLRKELNQIGRGGDIDLLVDPKHFEQSVRLFVTAGFDMKGRPSDIPFKRVLVMWYDGRVLTIDLHSRICQAGVIILDEQLVLKGRQAYKDYLALPLIEWVDYRNVL